MSGGLRTRKQPRRKAADAFFEGCPYLGYPPFWHRLRWRGTGWPSATHRVSPRMLAPRRIPWRRRRTLMVKRPTRAPKQPAKPERPSADSAGTGTSGLHAFARTPAVGVADILGGLVPDRVATPEKCRTEAARPFETWQGKGLAQRTTERPDRCRARRDSRDRAFRRPEREFDWLSSPRMMALRGEVCVAHSLGPPSVHNRTPELSVPWVTRSSSPNMRSCRASFCSARCSSRKSRII